MNIFYKLYQHPLLHSEEVKRIAAVHTRVSFVKGEEILNAGQRSNAYYLIEEGFFRSFVQDYEGKEITTAFCGPQEILIEVSSLFQRIPSNENIVAITDGKGYKIDFDDFQKLFHEIEGFREWGRAWMAEQLFNLKQRQLEMVSESAGQRYEKLLIEKPGIILYVTLKHIASYLGITDSSLSRIRKEMQGQ